MDINSWYSLYLSQLQTYKHAHTPSHSLCVFLFIPKRVLRSSQEREGERPEHKPAIHNNSHSPTQTHALTHLESREGESGRVRVWSFNEVETQPEIKRLPYSVHICLPATAEANFGALCGGGMSVSGWECVCAYVCVCAHDFDLE